MKKIAMVTGFIMCSQSIFAQSWFWSKVFPSSGGLNTYISSAFNDKDHNVYAIGKFSENITLSKTYSGIGIFIVKLDLRGNIIWEKVYTSTPTQYPSIAAVSDSSGNFYLLGYCDHELVAENGDKITAGTFLIQFDKNGHIKKDNPINAQEESIYISSSGKYVSCLIKNYSTIHIGTTTITEKGNVLLQTDTSGNFLWSAVFPATLHPKACATNGGGEVVITGEFQDSVVYNNTKIKSAGSNDAFILKLGTSGQMLWLRGYGQNGVDKGLGIAFDSHQNLYLTGDKTYNAFNTNLVIPATFIAALNADGDLLWGKETGDPATLFPTSRTIVVDEKEDIYLNGEFNADLYLNWSGPGIAIPHSKGVDTYAGMLPASTGVEWGLGVSGKGDEKSTAMWVDREKNVTLAGIYTDSVVIGLDLYAGKGVFLCKSFKNTLPVILNFSNKSAIINTSYGLLINVQDDDSDSVFASVSGLPAGFYIERVSAKSFDIKGTAITGQEGSYAVKLSVADLYGTTEKEFVFNIVNESTPLPLELLSSSLPLTGGTLYPSEPIVYQFNHPVMTGSLVYQIGAAYLVEWTNNQTILTIHFQNLSDQTTYTGYIILQDSLGNTFSKDIGFQTNFSTTAIGEKKEAEEEPLSQVYFDTQGRITEYTSLENLPEGLYLLKSLYRSGKVSIKKVINHK
jgi:hypothetical protein